MTPQRYRSWLELAVVGVWRGGLYEAYVFYDSCDELGLLIWHDFMLGYGAYPINDNLLHSTQAEAEYNLRPLRHHPCIVLRCGNNEDHMFAELHHLEYDMNDKNPQSWLKTTGQHATTTKTYSRAPAKIWCHEFRTITADPTSAPTVMI